MNHPIKVVQLMLITAVMVSSVSMAKPVHKHKAKKVTAPVVQQQQEPTGAAQSATSSAATGTTAPAGNPAPGLAPTTPTAPPATIVEVTPSVTGGTSETLVVTSPSESKFIGNVELRPSYFLDRSPGKNRYLGSENNIQIGYQINNDTKFLYDQNIHTVQDSTQPGQTWASKVLIQQADLHAQFNNLIGNANGGVAFSYEPLLKLPVGKAWRDEGKYVEVRNVFKLKHNYMPTQSISFIEMPIVLAYNGSDYANVYKGKTTVPAFENRVYIQFDGEIMKGLTYSVPVYWTAAKERGIGSATGLNWSHFVTIWPEVDYAINNNFTVGVAYRSGDLKLNNAANPSVAADFAEGFGTGGVFQAVIRASL